MKIRHSVFFFFILYILAIVVRAPRLFGSPRFWAEDGVIYYLQARALPFDEALWAMPLGYLSLPANVAGIVSALLPVVYAPYGNLIVSLTIMMLLFWVVVANKYFDGDRLKQSGLLLVSILVIQSAETWLNAINGQFWLTLAAAYVLAAPGGTFTPHRHGVNLLALLLAGLSGVVAAFLAPLFVLRAALERKIFWLGYAGLVAIGALVMLATHGGQGRSVGFPLDLFAVVGFFQIILDNLCIACAVEIFPQSLATGPVWLTALALLTAIYGVVWSRVGATGRWLLLASLTLMVLSFVGMLGKEQILSSPPYFNSRYFFAPAALFFSALLFVTAARARKIAVLVLIVFAVNGAYFAFDYPVVGERDGKAWKNSIKAFNKGQSPIVYFNKPLCGFEPARPGSKPEAPRFMTASATEIVFAAPRPASVDYPPVFLYRSALNRPGAWQKLDGGWKDSGLFLYGTTRFGQCYGGDDPVPAAWIRVDGERLIVNRLDLGELSGHTFLLGYGENFAAMLANRTFVQFAGDDLSPNLPPLNAAGISRTTTEFLDPMVEAVALDHCVQWAAGCGAPAADAFCRSRGYTYASDYGVTRNAPPTRVISSKALCESSLCARISRVTCVRDVVSSQVE